MKSAASLAACLLLAGCGSHGSWRDSHGSWLDAVGKPPTPPVSISEDTARELATRAAALRTQAEAIRVQLASESDRHTRFDHYRELRLIGDSLLPLERTLYEARRSSPTTTVKPPSS